MEYSSLALTGVDLSCQVAAALLFEKASLRRVNLSQTRLPGLRAVDARFDACDVSGADWDKARFRRVVWAECRLWGTALLQASFDDVLFEDCKAEKSVFASGAFRSVRFTKCDLREASFQEADLTDVEFHECDLSRADLRGARLKGTDLRGSVIDDVQVGVKELQGVVIEPAQAVVLAGLLGLIVKESDESLPEAPSTRLGGAA